MRESCITRDTISWPEGLWSGLRVPAVTRFSVSRADSFACYSAGSDNRRYQVTPPGRSVVSQSMTTARRGWSMVRAQLTAWSERRSQAGASAVVIIGVPPLPGSCCGGAVKFSTADHTDTAEYAPPFWRLDPEKPATSCRNTGAPHGTSRQGQQSPTATFSSPSPMAGGLPRQSAGNPSSLGCIRHCTTKAALPRLFWIQLVARHVSGTVLTGTATCGKKDSIVTRYQRRKR